MNNMESTFSEPQGHRNLPQSAESEPATTNRAVNKNKKQQAPSAPNGEAKGRLPKRFCETCKMNSHFTYQHDPNRVKKQPTRRRDRAAAELVAHTAEAEAKAAAMKDVATEKVAEANEELQNALAEIDRLSKVKTDKDRLRESLVSAFHVTLTEDDNFAASALIETDIFRTFLDVVRPLGTNDATNFFLQLMDPHNPHPQRTSALNDWLSWENDWLNYIHNHGQGGEDLIDMPSPGMYFRCRRELATFSWKEVHPARKVFELDPKHAGWAIIRGVLVSFLGEFLWTTSWNFKYCLENEGSIFLRPGEDFFHCLDRKVGSDMRHGVVLHIILAVCFELVLIIVVLVYRMTRSYSLRARHDIWACQVPEADQAAQDYRNFSMRFAPIMGRCQLRGIAHTVHCSIRQPTLCTGRKVKYDELDYRITGNGNVFISNSVELPAQVRKAFPEAGPNLHGKVFDLTLFNWLRTHPRVSDHTRPFEDVKRFIQTALVCNANIANDLNFGKGNEIYTTTLVLVMFDWLATRAHYSEKRDGPQEWGF